MEKRIDQVAIAAPCPISWESMHGDSRVRHCGACAKNVYNISDMTSVEAEAFLQSLTEGACLRIFRRNDGTIITDNCPRSLRIVRDKLRLVAKVTTGLLASLLSFWLPSMQQGSFAQKASSDSTKTDTKIANEHLSSDAQTSAETGAQSGAATQAADDWFNGNQTSPEGKVDDKPIKVSPWGYLNSNPFHVNYEFPKLPFELNSPKSNELQPLMGESVASPTSKTGYYPGPMPRLHAKTVLLNNDQCTERQPAQPDNTNLSSPSQAPDLNTTANTPREKGAYKLYLQAKANEEAGKLLLAKTQYTAALRIAEFHEIKADPAFISILKDSLQRVNKLIAPAIAN